ncbi:MAG: SynChlorMet cassette radical SAM/SPASM protein ScmE [Chlorobium sp.]|nr:MAG: SynChlorMet cassette radical SAM/SPASM protein ScmE [Chlorobium sp.]
MLIMKTPKSVDIDITNRCNLRCKHCYYYTSTAETAYELGTEEWLKFFEELNRCAVMSINIAGGEPFIREDFRDIINGIVLNRMRFSILSNGTLITPDYASFLKNTKRCDYVQVSIDGSGDHTHKLLRGEGNFFKAVEGIQNLQNHGVPVSVRVTIFRGNVDDLEKIATYLLEDLGLPSFSTNDASYMGLCRSHTEDIQLSTENRTKAIAVILSLQQKYPGRITAQAGPLAEADRFAKIESARLLGETSLPGGGYLTACGCIFNKIAVRADGTIVPCTMLSQIELGRINLDDLTEIWQTHPTMEAMRKRNRIPLSNFSWCEGCEYINFCTGNCPALAFTSFGVIDHPSPSGCIKRFLANGGSFSKTQTDHLLTAINNHTNH